MIFVVNISKDVFPRQLHSLLGGNNFLYFPYFHKNKLTQNLHYVKKKKTSIGNKFGYVEDSTLTFA